MATYIPNITDVFPEPYIYKPDLAFYDKMLQRKTALYEEGISKARSAWESVLNAPLSNKYNIQIRDEYIKQARANLQKMAGFDFAQPQNVAAARGIFAPFWEDNFIVKDAQLTKAYQNEFQTLESWKNSDDPKIREQYSGVVAKDLQNGLDVLINANRTDDDFSKVQKRKAIPFTNIEKYLNEVAGKDGLKIVWDETSADGAYLISTENGERSKKHFATWAESMIGNNFYEQFSVTGRVEKEERYKQYKNQFPNLTDAQIYEKMADDVVGEFDKGYQKRKNNVAVEIARINGLLNALPKNLTPEYQQAALQYQKQKAELLGKSNAIDKEYEINFPKNYQAQLKNNIILNPEGFFGKLAKQRLVDNWSTGVSSLESRKIKPNETYFKAQEAQLNQRKFDLDVLNYELNKQEAEWKRDQDLWERANPNKKTDGSGGSSGVTTNALGQLVDKKGNVLTEPIKGIETVTGGRYLGLGTTNVIEQGTAAEIFDRRQKELFYSSYNLAFSPDGLLYFAKNGLGLTDAEVASISSAFDNELRGGLFNPGAPDYKFTPEQAAASKKLEKLLIENKYVKEAGITKLTGPGTMRNALIAYTQGYLKDRMDEAKNHIGADGKPQPLDFMLTAQEQKALINYNVAKTNLEVYLANEENRKQILDKYAKTNPAEANKYFTKKNDGTYELLTSEKLAQISEVKAFKDFTFTTYAGVPIIGANLPIQVPNMFNIKLKPEAIAQAIFNNKFSYKIIGGYKTPVSTDPTALKSIQIEMNGETLYAQEKDLLKLKQTIDNFTDKFGEPWDFRKNYNKVYNSVVPSLQFFSSQTGKVGTNFSYLFDPEKSTRDGDKAFALFQEVLEPANAEVYIEESNGTIREATIPEMAAIRKLQQNEKQTEQYFGGFKYNTAGGGLIAGRANISVDFGAITDGSKIVLGTEKLTDLAGKKFVFAINEGSPSLGPNLRDMPKNSGYYIYQTLLRGKQFKSDDMMNATGFNFTLTPDRDGSTPQSMPSTVRLNLKYNVRINEIDPKTNEMRTRLEERQITDRIFSLQEKTPDEIVFEIQKIYYDNLKANFDLQQKYEEYLKNRKNTQNTGGGSPSIISRDLFFNQNGINLK